MALGNPTPGIYSAIEYQVSAIPWITSSNIPAGTTTEFDFEHVTKWVTVKNNAGGTVAAVGVTRNGVEKSDNHFFLIGGESVNLDWRVVRIFVSASMGVPNVSVIAGVTGIPSSRSEGLYYLTGSNGLEGVG